MSTKQEVEMDIDLTLHVACEMNYVDRPDCPNTGVWRAEWDIHCRDARESYTLCEFHKGSLWLPIWVCPCGAEDIRLIDYVTRLDRL